MAYSKPKVTMSLANDTGNLCNNLVALQTREMHERMPFGKYDIDKKNTVK
jgi:hypothetical protein